MGSKFDQNNECFLDGSWKGCGAQKGALTILSWAAKGPRGGVGEGLNPLPRGKRDFGKKDSWKEGAAKPPVAQRAGGIFRNA